MEAPAVALHLLRAVHGPPAGPALVAAAPHRHPAGTEDTRQCRHTLGHVEGPLHPREHLTIPFLYESPITSLKGQHSSKITSPPLPNDRSFIRKLWFVMRKVFVFVLPDKGPAFIEQHRSPDTGTHRVKGGPPTRPVITSGLENR